MGRTIGQAHQNRRDKVRVAKTSGPQASSAALIRQAILATEQDRRETMRPGERARIDDRLAILRQRLAQALAREPA